MANVLKMAKIQSIQQLHAAGWSQRRIASELEIDRGTVARYLRAPPSDPKPAIVPTGSDGPNAATLSPLPAPAPEGPPGSGHADSAAASKAAILPAGSGGENPVPAARSAPSSPRGRPGQCEAYHQLIQAKLDQQLTAQRIWQDLVAEQGFLATRRVVGPLARQVQRAVEEGGPTRGAISEEHADLAILDASRRAGILPLDADRLHALLQKAGLIDNQHAVGFAELLDDIFPQVVADLVGAPFRTGDEVLQIGRRLVAEFLGELPTILALEARKQPTQIPGSMPPLFAADESTANPLRNGLNLAIPTLNFRQR